MKYSIIMPVYNTDIHYLKEAIESVLNQTYNNIEFIIVNDGSKEEIKKYLEQYKNRIKVYNNTNNGVSYSRNFGTKKATGDYIIYIDSDDIISSTYVSEMNELLIKNDYDMILSQVTFNKELIYDSKNGLCTDVNKKELLSYYLTFYNRKFKSKRKWLNRGPVARIIKKEIALCNPFDEEEKFAEDVLWNIQLINKINKVGFYNKSLYYYRKNNDSTTQKYHKNFKNELNSVIKKIKNNLVDYDTIDFSAACFEYFIIYMKLDLFHKNNSNKIDKMYLNSVVDELLNKTDVKKVPYKYYNYKNKIKLFLIKHKLINILYLIERK